MRAAKEDSFPVALNFNGEIHRDERSGRFLGYQHAATCLGPPRLTLSHVGLKGKSGPTKFPPELTPTQAHGFRPLWDVGNKGVAIAHLRGVETRICVRRPSMALR